MINCREEALLKLGFAETAAPSQDDIKKQYRLLALKFHPDKVNAHSFSAAELEKVRFFYTEEFKKISQAYQILLLPLADQPRRADLDDDARHVCCVVNFISPELLFQRVFCYGASTFNFLIAQLNNILTIFDDDIAFEKQDVDCDIHPSEFKVITYMIQRTAYAEDEFASQSSMKVRHRKGISLNR